MANVGVVKNGVFLPINFKMTYNMKKNRHNKFTINEENKMREQLNFNRIT